MILDCDKVDITMLRLRRVKVIKDVGIHNSRLNFDGK